MTRGEGVAPTRPLAGFFFLIGIVLGWIMWSELSQGKYCPKCWIIFPPALLMGAMGLVDPRYINAWHSTFRRDKDLARIKLIGGIAWAISLTVALYFAIGFAAGFPMPAFITDRINGAP
jgi:hypothetical protein